MDAKTAPEAPGSPVPPAAPVVLPIADTPDLGLLLDGFAAAFTALSGLLTAAPSAAALQRCRAPELLADWPLLDDPDCARGAALVRASGEDGEDETAIRRDYNRLFYGPGPMLAVPYESVHRSDEHLVFEAETMQVRAAYAQFGLAAPRLNKEPDDHLGLEFGFLGTLCVRAMDAVDAADDAELQRVLAAIAEFLDEHLLVWGPKCLTQAADGARTQFYRGVAALGLGTLRSAQGAFLSGS